MAIQDLINEVNSIQTKKQAIKEAITAKGVTSEGKLSKFADEIKQITTGEPDWYIVNKFRYDNGNEALLVRTSDKTAASANKFQMVEIGGGVMKSNSVSNSFNSYYNGDFCITNGTYFPRETAYRSFTTKNSSNVVFDGHNDNLKLSLRDGKEIVFNDVNVYNWLKGYRNQPLADFNTLYLKSDGINDESVAKALKDFLASSNETRMSTLGEYGQNPLLLIDSSIMIQAMNFRAMPKTGFIYYSDKTVDAVSLIPVSYTNTNSDFTFYKDKEKLYGNLSPGNYIHLYIKNSSLFIMFVSVNFVVDSNGQKHKNIEVYIYSIVKENKNNIDFFKLIDKPFELYLTFSSRAQQQLQQASTPKVFRRQVLVANGTPEAIPMYLNGLDMLGRFTGVRGKFVDRFDNINNLFSREKGGESVEHQSVPYSSGPFRSMIMPPDLAKAIKSKAPIKAFIRLNDNTNNMTFVEFEEIPNDGKFTFSVGYGQYGLAVFQKGINNDNRVVAVFQKGINNDNRVVAVFLDNLSQDKCKIYRLKKAGTNQYITNDLFDTTQKDNQLFITANKETIDHISKTPLATVWTEIQNTLAHKEDYEAYSISNYTYEE
nr:MAG TPA: hypothetical protein [Caudoviricetes sp.]